MSRPFISSSSETLKPIIFLIILNNIKEPMNANAADASMATICIHIWPGFPNKRPFAPAAFIAVLANIPVAKAPQTPLTPWQAKTSKVSSNLVLSKRQFETRFETRPAIKPIAIAANGPTKPEAGVIATKPQTAPIAVPVAVGFPLTIQSMNIQLKAAHAAAILVTKRALIARPYAANALPPLNPNQPNQSNAVPRITNGMLFGFACLFSFFLLPTTIAPANAENPARICTTVPPAKSKAPMLLSQPPVPHTQ